MASASPCYNAESGAEVRSFVGPSADKEGPAAAHIAFGPDGNLLALGCADHTVRLWDWKTGKEVGSADGYHKALAISPDGKRLALCDDRDTIHIRPTQPPTAPERTRRLWGYVHAIRFSRDGRRMVTLELGQPPNDETARVTVWDAASGTSLVAVSLKSLSNPQVAISPDGRALATTAPDIATQLFDVATGAELLRLAKDRSVLGFSADGKHLLCQVERKRVALHDVVSGTEVRSFDTGEPLALSPDGRALVARSRVPEAHDLEVWDAQSGTLRHCVPMTWRVDKVDFTPDGASLYVWAQDRLHIWDVVAGKEIVHLASLPPGSDREVRAVSPDGRRVVRYEPHKDQLALVDVATGETVLALEKDRGQISSLAFAPDGQRLLAGTSDGALMEWAAPRRHDQLTLSGRYATAARLVFAAEGRLLAAWGQSNYGHLVRWDLTVARPEWAQSIQVNTLYDLSSDRAGRFLTTSSNTKGVTLWDGATGQELRTLVETQQSDGCVAITPAGDRMAATVRITRGAEMVLFEVPSGRRLSSWSLAGRPTHIAFSPDGRLLAWNETKPGPQNRLIPIVRIWDHLAGKEVRSIEGNGQGIESFAFSPDGKSLATGAGLHYAFHNAVVTHFDQPAALAVWDLSTGKLAHEVGGHLSTITSIAYSADGKWLASASMDGTVKVWNVETGKLATTLLGYRGPVEAVAFSPDGKWLATGTGQNIKVWDQARWAGGRSTSAASP